MIIFMKNTSCKDIISESIQFKEEVVSIEKYVNEH